MSEQYRKSGPGSWYAFALIWGIVGTCGVAGTACTGKAIGHTGVEGTPNNPHPSDDIPSQQVDNCEPEGSLARSPMRLITALEYDYAVEDLLGDTTRTGREILPSDEVMAGYANNTAISLQVERAEKYQAAARKVAERAMGNLGTIISCADGDEACVHDFMRRFARRALRRPLENDEFERFAMLYRAKRERTDHKQAIRLFLEAILQYPSFIYRPVQGVQTSDAAVRKLTGFEIAARLSFFLWSSVPDDELMTAAESGELDTVAGVRAQAERMMADRRFERSIKAFSLQWLNVDEHAPMKDPQRYPNFNAELWASMRESVARFFSDVVHNGGDMETLMLGPYAFVDRRLAPIYNVQVSGDGFSRIETNPAQRGGIMTQAAVMSALGNTLVSQPIKRGLFVRNRLFCQDPPPPPPEGVPPFEAPRENLTIREQLEAHRANPTCAGCHAFFDNLGLAFEHFDGVGAYHETQEGRPIDASGVLDETDVNGPYKNAMEMMRLLHKSKLVTECLTVQVMRFAIGRLEDAADRCVVKSVLQTFSESGHSLPKLFAAIATSDSFRFTGSN